MRAVYRAQVRDNTDPTGRGLLEVYIPALDLVTKAETVASPGYFNVPRVGVNVTVLQAGDDTGDRYYYLGVWRRSLQGTPQDGTTQDARIALKRIVDAAALRYNIPIAFLRAVVRQESAWNPRALNRAASGDQWQLVLDLGRQHRRVGGQDISTHAKYNDPTAWGAYGLGQVVLLTALDIGFPFAADPSELLDAATGANYAAKYLRRMHDYAGGDPAWAAAAYFGGTGRAPTADPVSWQTNAMRKYSASVTRYYTAELAGGTSGSVDTPPTALGEDDQSTSGLVRFGRISAPAVVDLQQVQVEAGRDSQLPDAYMGANYPHNQVLKTPAGHVFEVDDTEGAERVHVQHGSGLAFFEIGPQGQQVERRSAEVRVVDGASTERTGKKLDIVEGNRRVHTAGQETVTAGARIDRVNGLVQRFYAGSLDEQVVGERKEETVGPRLIKADGPIKIVGTQVAVAAATGSVVVVAGAGDVDVIANQSIDIQSIEGAVRVGSVVEATKQAVLLRPLLVDLMAVLTTIQTALTALQTAGSPLPGAGMPLASLVPPLLVLSNSMAQLNTAMSTGVASSGLAYTGNMRAD